MSMETPTANEAAPAEKRASGSSFYTAMRILPQAQRDAMFQIYSFCRAVDDIADSTGPRQQRVRELAGWRDDIAAMLSRQPASSRTRCSRGPVLSATSSTARQNE